MSRHIVGYLNPLRAGTSLVFEPATSSTLRRLCLVSNPLILFLVSLVHLKYLVKYMFFIIYRALTFF